MLDNFLTLDKKQKGKIMRIKINYPIGSYLNINGTMMRVVGIDCASNEIKYHLNNGFQVYDKQDCNIGLRQTIISEPIILL